MTNAGKMKSKQNQNIFIKIVKTPVRVLCKARDLYVRSIIKCSDGVGYGHTSMGGQYALPKSFSTASTRSSSQYESEDFRELLRAASARGYGHKNELEMYLQQLKQSMATPASTESKPLPKSVSVGMGFMGRIDEDTPCEFEEEEGGVKKKEIYPRSKSVAVAKRSSVM